jgi:hypothetical protein
MRALQCGQQVRLQGRSGLFPGGTGQVDKRILKSRIRQPGGVAVGKNDDREPSGSLIFSVTGNLKMSVKGSGPLKNSFAAAQNLFRLKYDNA